MQIGAGACIVECPPGPSRPGQDPWIPGGADLESLGIDTVEAQEPSALIRAFRKAHKDVIERLSGVDFAPISGEKVRATWERTEREVLLETNRKHDWEHRKSPWFRLYFHFY